MRTITHLLIILGMGFYFTSCVSKRVMTREELNLIEEFSADTAFRVLQVTDADDYKLLRTRCADVNLKSKALKTLIARMRVTLEKEQGVGIAAPQVGLARNLFLFARIDKPGTPIEVAINPRITNHPDETICFERDGCLSIPNRSGNSIRYPWVEVEYTNEQGERIKEKLEGYSRKGNFTAVIFQHEYDHLQGVLFTDKLCETPSPTPEVE
jgi:peptide deformylase